MGGHLYAAAHRSVSCSWDRSAAIYPTAMAPAFSPPAGCWSRPLGLSGLLLIQPISFIFPFALAILVDRHGDGHVCRTQYHRHHEFGPARTPRRFIRHARHLPEYRQYPQHHLDLHHGDRRPGMPICPPPCTRA